MKKVSNAAYRECCLLCDPVKGVLVKDGKLRQVVESKKDPIQYSLLFSRHYSEEEQELP